jgi:exodeoxyribonuclease V alpha subunit
MPQTLLADADDLTTSFDGRSATYGFGELDVLVPAYAANSQEPRLRISRRDHPGSHSALPDAQHNPLYAGVTRGKRLVVLVGQKKAVAIAVRNASSRRRWSKLEEWLRLAAPRVGALPQ